MQTYVHKHWQGRNFHTDARGPSFVRLALTSAEILVLESIPYTKLYMEEIYIAGIKALADVARTREQEAEVENARTRDARRDWVDKDSVKDGQVIGSWYASLEPAVAK